MDCKQRHQQLEVYWKIFLNSECEEERNDTFSSLYFLSVDELLRYGSGMGFDQTTCEDSIHDIFCLIYMKRHQLMAVSNFTGYLFRAFRNAMFNVYKKNAKLTDKEISQLPFATEVTILDTMISEEQQRNITATITNIMGLLTDRQREAIYLRYMQDLDYGEIAELMDLEVASVRKLVYRSILVLRKRSNQFQNPLLNILVAWWCITRS